MVSKNEILQSQIFDFKVFPQPDGIISACRGDNKKGLFLALAGEQNPGSIEFLEKVMKAVNYDLHHDALTVFVTSQESFSLMAIKSEREVRRAVFFGIHPRQAGIHLLIPLYQAYSFQGITYLFADDLAKIEQNQDLKRKLWLVLKEMFSE